MCISLSSANYIFLKGELRFFENYAQTFETAVDQFKNSGSEL